MSYMFKDCSSLTNLNISNFYTANVTDFSRMFSNCSSLESLDMRNMTFNNVPHNKMSYIFENIPSNCTIKAKDASTKSTVESHNSSLTGVVIAS